MTSSHNLTEPSLDDITSVSLSELEGLYDMVNERVNDLSKKELKRIVKMLAGLGSAEILLNKDETLRSQLGTTEESVLNNIQFLQESVVGIRILAEQEGE